MRDLTYWIYLVLGLFCLAYSLIANPEKDTILVIGFYCLTITHIKELKQKQ